MVPSRTHPLLIGITGVPGSGKSTVLSLLARHGVSTLDTDILAREALKPGSPGEKSVLEAFGERVRSGSGGLDRGALRRLVAQDPRARRRLEEIVHPAVRKRLEQRIEELASEGAEFVAVEVPLLFEAGWSGLFDMTVAVTAPSGVIEERLKRRNGAAHEEVEALGRAQLPQEEKARFADYLIENSGNLEELAREVERLLARARYLYKARRLAY